MAKQLIMPISDLRSAIFELASSPEWSAATLIAVVSSFLILGGADGSFGAILAVLMAMIAATDRRSFIIPDVTVILAIVVGLETNFTSLSDLTQLLTAVARGAIAALVFQILRLLYRGYRGRQGMGFGDVKLAMAAGIWLDWFFLATTIEMAALTALAITFVTTIIARKGRLCATLAIPFGAYLAPWIWIVWIIQAKMNQLL